MSTATAINEFTPDTCTPDVNGRKWLTVSYTDQENPATDFPKIVSYEGERYYWMSFNSDKNVVIYAAAGDRAYHERYRH